MMRTKQNIRDIRNIWEETEEGHNKRGKSENKQIDSIVQFIIVYDWNSEDETVRVEDGTLEIVVEYVGRTIDSQYDQWAGYDWLIGLRFHVPLDSE